MASHAPTMGGKWLEVLKETAPHLTRALGGASRLLRARREQPYRCSGAEDRYELAAVNHSITSSAMARSPDGRLGPNALAVLRSITNSNLATS
jgi:hypothetical protein